MIATATNGNKPAAGLKVIDREEESAQDERSEGLQRLDAVPLVRRDAAKRERKAPLGLTFTARWKPTFFASQMSAGFYLY